MSKKLKISALTFGAILATSASITLAEPANKIVSPTGESNVVNIHAPVTAPSAPLPINNEGDASKLNDLGMNTNTLTDNKMAAPTQTISETPKADGSIIDKLVSHYNNKEVEDIISMFSSEGFVKIGADGNVIKDNVNLRKYLVNMFAGEKKHTYTAQVDMVKEIAPDIALITAQYNSFEDGQATTPMAKLYVVTMAKYENNNWKIVSQQATEVSKETTSMDIGIGQSNAWIKMTIVGLIGAIIGFFASRFMDRRKYPNQHPNA